MNISHGSVPVVVGHVCLLPSMPLLLDGKLSSKQIPISGISNNDQGEKEKRLNGSFQKK
jgi:hypothetical protein